MILQSFSDHLYTWNDETVDYALKNASLELNMIDLGNIFEDHLYTQNFFCRVLDLSVYNPPRHRAA